MSNQYVVVMPDGREYFAECGSGVHLRNREYFGECSGVHLRNLCEDAVRRLDYKSPRKNPITIKVKVYRLDIVEGALVRKFIKDEVVQPSLERMTDEEYVEEMNELLKDIPKEFHDFVRNDSYDRGHSAGMEEVISYATELVSNLKPCIASFVNGFVYVESFVKPFVKTLNDQTPNNLIT